MATAVIHIDCAPGETNAEDTEMDRGRCSICQEPWQEKIDQGVPIEATITSCGHAFCTECLFWAKESCYYEDMPCPICRGLIPTDTVPAPGEVNEQDVVYVRTVEGDPTDDVVDVVEDLE